MDNKVIKLITIICIWITILALIVARNSPAVEYEASIYTATPIFVWFALLLNLICGITIIVHQLAYKHKKSNLWLFGLVLILFTYVIFQSLWIIRGYPLYSIGDPAFHLGAIKDVFLSGHIDERSIYPILYVIAVEISNIVGISVVTVQKTLSLVFSLFFVLFVYVFAKGVLGKKGQIIIATIAGMAFVLPQTYLNFTPNYIGNFIIPLAFFILLKNYEIGSYEWKIIMVIFIFLLPLFHPVLALVFVIILFSPWIAKKTASILTDIYLIFKAKFLKKPDFRIRSKSSLFNIKTVIPIYITAAILLFVWTISWVSSFFQWNILVKNTYNIITEGASTELDIVSQAIQYGSSLGYNPIVHFLKLYGDLVIFLLLVMIGLFLIRSSTLSEKRLRKFFYVYSSLFIFIILTGIFFFLNLGFGNDRLFVYIVMISTPIAGFVFYQFLQRSVSHPNKVINRKTGPILLIFILTGFFIVGGSSIYASSYTHVANWQITKTELDGMKWFFSEKDINMKTSTFTVVPGRFANILLSSQEHENRSDIPLRFGTGITTRSLVAKYHFGYENYTYLGQQYPFNIYLVLNKKDRKVYQEVLPELAKIRYLPQDFNRLENDDVTVNTIYSNGGLDVYFVNFRQKS